MQADTQISLFKDSAVETEFDNWSRPSRECGYWLRELIFQTARNSDGVGAIEETLKWNQPSYLTHNPKSGSTIRIGEIDMGARVGGARVGLYFHCQTSLVETFRYHYSTDLEFEKNRAIIIDPVKRPEVKILEHCIALALRYHLDKR